MEAVIKLIEPGDIDVEVFANVNSAGRNEFSAAGQAGYKAALTFEIWNVDYNGQKELEYDGVRYSIYRTYGPRRDDKIELYTQKRIGNRS